MPATGGSEPSDRGQGTLYVVATPIGNLDDLGARAARILTEVDVVACEDTRHSRRLLDRLGSRASRIAHHDHNELASARGIVDLLERGRSVALVSDAGTPSVSDPGRRAVRAALEGGHRVCAIPGPSAALAALSVAGLPTDSFGFEGFLPAAPGKRRARLRVLAQQRRLFGGTTLVLFESPRRLAPTLEEVAGTLGDVEVALCRELTKLHESVLRGSAAALAAQLRESPVRGEAVLVIDTRSATPPEAEGEPERRESPWATQARELLREGVAPREALRRMRRAGIPKEAARAALQEVREAPGAPSRRSSDEA